jgi:hypothetical protein
MQLSKKLENFLVILGVTFGCLSVIITTYMFFKSLSYNKNLKEKLLSINKKLAKINKNITFLIEKKNK